MRKSLFHWWLLSWLSLSPSSTWIFCVTGLIVQEQTLFIHLMDIAYIRQDRICIHCFHSTFDGYYIRQCWFNTWRRYSLVKFYYSRQQNILFVVHLMEIVSFFSLFYSTLRHTDYIYTSVPHELI